MEELAQIKVHSAIIRHQLPKAACIYFVTLKSRIFKPNEEIPEKGSNVLLDRICGGIPERTLRGIPEEIIRNIFE